MPKTLRQYINLISILAVCTILILLLFFSSQFSWLKIFIMFFLMIAFIYMLAINRQPARQQENISDKDDQKVNKNKNQQPTFGERLTWFFQNLNPNSYDHTSSNSWRIDRTYVQEIDYNQKMYSKSLQPAGKTGLSQHEEQQLRKRQFNILLPQNVNQIVNQIKKTVQPSSYLNLFNKELEIVKSKKVKGSDSSSRILFEDLAPNETYSFDDKSGKFMLVDNSELFISDPVYAVDILVDFLKDKIDNVIRNSHYSFKSVSQIMMKCFGLRVNFGLKRRSSNSNQKEVTMQEVKEFLSTFRRQNTIYQNFKLIIPKNEFMISYLERLIWTSQNVLGLLEHLDNPYVMSLKIYINALNESFPNENIRMNNDKSAYSPEMKSAKHVFYVHQSSKRVFFTYNNIKNFKTKNPLLALLAFFTEISKTSKYQYHDVVKNLNKRITDKYKMA